MLMALAAALALLAPSAAAAIEDEAGAGVTQGRVVEIRVSGDAAALARVKLTARELLLRLDVTPVVKAIDDPVAPPGEPLPLVIAYVDLLRVATPSIDIEDGQTHEELTRRDLTDVSSLETGVESVLHVLYLAVESKLQVGVTRPAPSPPVPPEKRPAPPAPRESQPARSRLGLDVGPLLRLSALGDGRFVPGGGLGVEPRADFGHTQIGVMVTAALHGTSELSFDHGAAEVRPLQVRVVSMFDWLLSRDVSAATGLGAGLDSLMVTPLQPPETGVAAPPQSALDPVLTAVLGARLPISGRAFFAALASLDYDLVPTSFVVRQGPTTHPILALPRLRGGFTLALDFTLAGEKRFSKAALEP
jgi:hypothetical protein